MLKSYPCFSCGMPQWVCEAKHFWGPILKGLFMAVIVGVIIGFLFKLIYNPGGLQ